MKLYTTFTSILFGCALLAAGCGGGSGDAGDDGGTGGGSGDAGDDGGTGGGSGDAGDDGGTGDGSKSSCEAFCGSSCVDLNGTVHSLGSEGCVDDCNTRAPFGNDICGALGDTYARCAEANGCEGQSTSVPPECETESFDWLACSGTQE